MIHLERIDPGRNMARFYRIDIAPDLFGGWTLTAEFGRIGQGGTVHLSHHASEDAARAALAGRQRQKLRRGYVGEGASCGSSGGEPARPAMLLARAKPTMTTKSHAVHADDVRMRDSNSPLF